MNIFTHVKNFFGGLAGHLTKFFSSADFHKAEEIAKAIGDLLKYAIPAVEFVASLTPTKTDDEIVAVIKKLQVATAIDLDAVLSGQVALSKEDKNGLLMSAAAAALRGNLKDAIVAAAGVGLTIGGEVVKSSTQIPDNWINTAVTSVYSAVKTGATLA